MIDQVLGNLTPEYDADVKVLQKKQNLTITEVMQDLEQQYEVLCDRGEAGPKVAEKDNGKEETALSAKEEKDDSKAMSKKSGKEETGSKGTDFTPNYYGGGYPYQGPYAQRWPDGAYLAQAEAHITCFNCGERGHRAIRCPRLQGQNQPEQVNAAVAQNGSNGNSGNENGNNAQSTPAPMYGGGFGRGGGRGFGGRGRQNGFSGRGYNGGG